MAKINVRKRGRLLPASSAICDALTEIKTQNRKGASRGFSEKSGFTEFQSGSREMLFLGKLLVKWKEIVGADLFKRTYPHRLIKGSLFLLCSDSQWLQTLNFLKENIKDKIVRMFPDMKVREIRGKIGIIPKEGTVKESAPWPDWENEDAPEINASSVKPEIKEAILRCARKTRARIRGIRETGMDLCPVCQSSIVQKGSKGCSMCSFRKKNVDISQARALLSENPWLRFEDIRTSVPEVSEIEFNLLCEEISGEIRQQIISTITSSSFISSEENIRNVRLEVVRIIALRSGIPLQSIDLENSDHIANLEPELREILFRSPEEAV